jgi:hypothetical protein
MGVNQRIASPPLGQRTYRCEPGIAWLSDARRILLVHTRTGQSWVLHGTQAALWDWLALAHTYDEAVCLMARLVDASPEQAERVVQTILNDWHAAGIVQTVEGEGHG